MNHPTSDAVEFRLEVIVRQAIETFPPFASGQAEGDARERMRDMRN